MKNIILFLVILISFSSLIAQELPEPNETTILQQWTLCSQFVKNEAFDEAKDSCDWMLTNQEVVMQNDKMKGNTRLFYYRLNLFLLHQIENQEGETKSQYLRTWLAFEDSKNAVFEANGVDSQYWQDENKAFKNRFINILTYIDYLPEEKENLRSLYNEYFVRFPDEVHDSYLLYEIEILLNQLQNAENENDKQKLKQLVLDEMDKREPFIDSQENKDKIYQYREALFTSIPEKVAFYERQLEQDSENVALLEKLYGLYNASGNTEKLKVIAEKLKQLNPTVSVFKKLGKIAYDSGDIETAFENYQYALNLPDISLEEKEELLYFLATVSFQNNLFRDAYDFSQDLLQINKGNANAKELQDKSLVSLARCCGTNLSCRAIYWTIPGYESAGPTSEEYFFEGWRKGQKIKVGGCMAWTGRTAIVR